MDQYTEFAPEPAPVPAPYGRACLGCVKAKCKCIFPNGTGKYAFASTESVNLL
ncbi:hypothetical protein V8E51_019779, partial [Hyaloscypha variabilis]